MVKKWRIQDNIIGDKILKNNPDISPVILQLLNNRGLNINEIKSFLEPNYKEDLHDPFKFRDMKESVELIFKHIKNGSKITIYGDYDADGVTATAVMYKTLEFLGAKDLDIYIPHRETEGYGMNKNAIEESIKNNTKLIITVDTGIRSIDEIKLAKEKGLDVILTDHHECGDEVPDCLIINPKVEGEIYPFRELAGVGVAFKVAQALLLARADQTQISDADKRGYDAFEKWLLDLVAIGTIADLVPLVNENRVLVNYGLVVLNKTKRLGIEKLIEIAQSNTDKNGNARVIDAWQVGYQLAPRLNAAGRLGHANSAYQLLVTDDKKEAIKIASELDKTNKERQDITQEIFEQADRTFAEATAGKRDDKILFAICPELRSPRSEEGVEGEGWPSGVMGLVAGKLTEKYYRPALAITIKEGDNGREIVGSARSVPEFDIVAMLEKCSEFLSHYGGHKQAAGFTVKDAMFKKFLEKAKKITEEQLKDIELIPTLEIDLEINFSNVSENLYETLQKLKPFGVKNAQPKFLSKNLKVVNVIQMGKEKQHLKLKVQGDKIVHNAVAFNIIDEWKEVKVGDEIDLVYYIDMNEWNGSKSVQLKIIDLKIN